MSGPGNLLRDQNDNVGICLQKIPTLLKELSLSPRARLAQRLSEPLGYLKSPEAGTPVRPGEWPGVGSGRTHTGHAQVARRVGLGAVTSPKRLRAPSARELVCFQSLGPEPVRREPPGRTSSTPGDPGRRCPATASLTMSSREEGRRRSWVREATSTISSGAFGLFSSDMKKRGERFGVWTGLGAGAPGTGAGSP